MHRLCVILCVAAVSAAALAQTSSEKDLLSLVKFREQVALDVAAGALKAAPALAKLREGKAGVDFTGDREEDFALAASDVGRRLVAKEKRAEAEEFFRAAEVALTSSIAARKGPDKARALAARALLRVQFLGDPDGAKRDVDNALKFAPDDPMLKSVGRTVARGHGKKEPAPPTQFSNKPWVRGN